MAVNLANVGWLPPRVRRKVLYKMLKVAKIRIDGETAQEIEEMTDEGNRQRRPPWVCRYCDKRLESAFFAKDPESFRKAIGEHLFNCTGLEAEFGLLNRLRESGLK